MVAEINAKWELFVDIVFALLNDFIFIVIVLYVIWNIVKKWELDKKIKGLVSSEIDRKILARDIKQTWFKVKKNPFEVGDRHFTMDNVLGLSLVLWGSIFVIGLLAFTFKGPWVRLRFDLGLPLMILGGLGLGITLILRGCLRFGVGFLKVVTPKIAIFLSGFVWIAITIFAIANAQKEVWDNPFLILFVFNGLLGIFLIFFGISILLDTIKWTEVDIGDEPANQKKPLLQTAKDTIYMLLTTPILVIIIGIIAPIFLLLFGIRVSTAVLVGYTMILGGYIIGAFVKILTGFVWKGTVALKESIAGVVLLMVGLSLCLWSLLSLDMYRGFLNAMSLLFGIFLLSFGYFIIPRFKKGNGE